MKLSETQKGSSTKWFGTETKLFWRKILIPAPFLNPNIFRYQKFSETRVSLRNFSLLWDKIFDIKSWYSLPPSPLLSIKFSDTRNFAKHRRFPLRSFFGTLRQQIFYRKSWYSPLWHKIFQYVKLSETQKGSSTKWFGTETKLFWRKILIPAPFLNPNIFRYQKFSETRVSLRNFSLLWDKMFDIKSWYSLPPSPLLSIKFSDTRNFAKHRRFPLRSFFGTLRQQIFYRKSWYSPLWHKIFQYVKLSETQKGSSMKWFGTETKKFWT